MAFFAPAGAPRIGTAWKPFVDHSRFAPTALADFVILGAGPTNQVVAGGTLLCNPPHATYVDFPGVPIEVPIPFDVNLIGTSMCSQGGSFLPGSMTAYANALDLVIGL